MRRHLKCLAVFFCLLTLAGIAWPQGKLVYNCADYIRNWTIPDWSAMKRDHVNPILAVDESFSAEKGSSSLKLNINFDGKSWSAGIIETEGIFDLTLYRSFTFDVYIPTRSPKGLAVRVIIVSGDDYRWIEMSQAVPVEPGRRTVIKADLRQGSRSWRYGDGSGDARITDDLKESVSKIGIRIESDSVPYAGPVYVDGIRMEK